MHQLFVFTSIYRKSPKNQYQPCARQFTVVLLPPSIEVTGPRHYRNGLPVIDLDTLNSIHHKTRGLFV